MKTSKSKKLLSFFLAVVMLVTSCSVGFTAFAADGDNGMWKDSTKASTTYDALNDLFDTSLPTILDAIGADTLGKIGVNVTAVKAADKPMYEFMSELAPLLIGALGSSSTAAKTLGTSYTGISDTYYSYLNDSGAAMSFWNLYAYCNDNSSDSYCKSVLPILETMLNQYSKVKTDNEDMYNGVRDDLKTLCGFDADAGLLAMLIPGSGAIQGVPDAAIAPYSLSDINTAPVNIAENTDGKTLNDYASSIDNAKAYINYVQMLLQENGTIAKDKELTFAEAVYYDFFTNAITAGNYIYLVKGSGQELKGALTAFTKDEDGNPAARFVDVALDGSKSYFDAAKATYPITEYYADMLNAFGFDYSTATPELQKAADAYYENALYKLDVNVNKSFATGKDTSEAYYNMLSKLLVKAGAFASTDAITASRIANESSASEIMALQELISHYKLSNKSDDAKINFTTGVWSEDSGECSLSSTNSKDKTFKDTFLASSDFSDSFKLYFMNSLGTSVEDGGLGNFLNVRDSLYKNPQNSDDNQWTGTDADSNSTKTVIANLKAGSDQYYGYALARNYFSSQSVPTYTSADLSSALQDAIIFKNIIEPQIKGKTFEDSGKTYTYEYNWNKIKPQGDNKDWLVNTANSLLNNTIKTYIDPASTEVMLMGSSLGEIIQKLLGSMMETKDLDLYAQLKDVYKNVANNPVETVFNLLPLLTALVDELVVPIVFNQSGDVQNGFLASSVVDILANVLGTSSLLQSNGSTIGLGAALNIDLNTSLPAIMHWLIGDRQTDNGGMYYTTTQGTKVYYTFYNGKEYSAKTHLAVKKSFNTADKTYGYSINLTGANIQQYASVTVNGKAVTYDSDKKVYMYDGNSNATLSTLLKDCDGMPLATTMKYETNVPKFLDIYVVDKALRDANIATLNVSKDAETNTIAKEAITEIATFFTSAVDVYLDGGTVGSETMASHRNDAKHGATNDVVANRGINNLLVSIPGILDIMGKMYTNKYNIASDWNYNYKIKTDGTLTADLTKSGKDTTYTFVYNDSLKNMKDLTNSRANNKQTKVLETFVDIFVNDWFNAIVDLLNDTTASNNKITSQTPIIKSLLDAVGGLGSKSAISDILNGVFQLDYTDDASFVMGVYDKESGYSGISENSAYFLLSNVGQLIKLFKSIDTKTANLVTKTYSTSSTGKAVTQPVWGNVPATSSKDGATFVSRLDAALSGLLEKSTINNFNMNSTAGIASGVISLLSYYFGSDNSNDMIKLLNSYLYQLNAQDKKGTNTSNAAIYTEDNLTNLVVQTYSLLENIIEYFVTEQDAVKMNVFYDSKQAVYSSNADGRYVYNVLASALKGLISPHAVSNHITDKSAAAKLASLPTWHNALKISGNNGSKTGETAISIKWGFNAGDTKSFYNSMSESLGIITGLAGTLLSNAGLYNGVVYPLLSDIQTACGKDLGVYNKGAVTNGSTALMSIITPVGNLLTAFYSQPASVLCNLLKGVSIFVSKDMNTALHSVSAAVLNEIQGISNILGKDVSNLIPSLAVNNKWFTKIVDLIVPAIQKDATKQAGLKTTINNLLYGNYTFGEAELMAVLNKALAGIVSLPATLFTDMANCANAQAVLDYLVKTVVNVLTSKGLIDKLKVLLNNSTISQLLDMLGQLSYDKLLNIINAVLAKTKDPTEVYWTFLQYVQKETTGFYYPAGITAQDADDAVDTLDNAVKSVMALLNGLDVVKKDNAKDLVSSLLFTNSNLTKLATALYGVFNNDIAMYMGYLGIDVSTDGVAALLMDKSYGKTYSSAAKKIKSEENWKDLSSANINWGFKDGSAKAEQGFVNALAAILRPFNNVLTLLLAGDSLAIGDMLDGLVANLEAGKSTDTVSFNKGILTIKVKGKDAKSRTSTIKLDLNAIVNEVNDLKIYGSNGYESAVVPLLETFMCDNVKTYAQYQKDISKAKDSVLTDVLTPIVGLVNNVLDAPFDTLTAVIPNIAYFLNNNGLSQIVNNLLSPITSLIPVLKNNGINLDTIIKSLLGKSLNDVITGVLGVNINLKLTDLNSCKLQKAIVPALNLLLKSLTKSDLKLPAISWATLASHGTVKTVKSAAKNAEGKYTTKRVIADQGETLIAVLRYVANTLTSNMKPIKKLLSGLKVDDKIMSIINVVLNHLSTASDDEIIQAIFYFLKEEPTNAFWNYTDYTTKEYDFTYPQNLDVKFLTQLSPMLDGLIGGLIDLNEKISDLLFTDSLVNKLAGAMYPAIQGVNINDNTTLTDLLSMTGIDFSQENVAKLLTDSSYGKTYSANASIISNASSWSKVNFDNMKWGVKDRASFFNALCAVLRPVYPVLDVLLNDASLGLFDIVSIPGSNGYTSVIVPLLEAFSGYNIKTQYQYREDISKSYDNILLDILNPLWDKVEDILSAPLQTLMAMLPNLALFIANNGLLQLIENLFVPVSALLDAVKPIVDVNEVLDAVLDMLNVDLDKTLSGLGLKLDLNINLYDLSKTLKPIIGSENIIPLVNQVLKLIKIKGTPLGIQLMDVDWYQLASHGDVVVDASQAATFGARVFVEGDSSEVLIAVLRFLIKTVNYQDNYNQINNLIGGLLGDNVSSSISGVIDQVLGMLQGDTDTVISDLCGLLQTLGS